MAVIITKANCNLSDANAFYRVEGHNLGAWPSITTYLYAISTARYLPIEFANAGNFKGAVFTFRSISTATNDRTFVAELEQGAEVLLPVASPGVATLAGHGFAVGQEIRFTTSATLPTGLTANTSYYARNTDCATPADQFHVYTSQATAIAGGSTGRVNFTGTPSGTHTVWIVISTKSVANAWDYICNNMGAVTYRNYGTYTINFDSWSSEPAVTTGAGKYRFRFSQTGGTTGTLNMAIGGSVATTNAIMYAAYCDTLATFTDNDTPIFAHYCDIDKSATFGGVLGLNDTVFGVAGIICSNTLFHKIDETTPNEDVCYLRCLSPAASYTLTLKGTLTRNGHAGIRIGTSSSLVPLDKQFIIKLDTATVGTALSGIRNYYGTYSSSYYFGVKPADFLYGACISKLRTTLTASTTSDNVLGKTVTMTNANPCVVTLSAHGYTGSEPVKFTTTGNLSTGGTTTLVPGQTYYVVYVNTTTFRISATPGGAALSTSGGTQSGTHYLGDFGVIHVAEDMILQGWKVGDRVAIGKQDIRGQGSIVPYFIKSISGTDITLSYSLLTYQRLSGGSVINIDEKNFGIYLQNVSTTAATGIISMSYNALTLIGVFFKNSTITGTPLSTDRSDDDDNAVAKCEIKNCGLWFDYSAGGYIYISTCRINRKGLEMDNCVSFRSIPFAYGTTGIYTASNYKSGLVSVKNTYALANYSTSSGGGGKIVHYFENIYIENSASKSASTFVLYMVNSIVKNVYIWGDLITTVASYASVANGATCIGNKIYDLRVENSSLGFIGLVAGISINTIFYDLVMGAEVANDRDYFIQDGSYFKSTFISSDFYRMSTADLTNTTEGSEIAFVDYYGVSHDDRVQTAYGNFQRCGDGLSDTTVHTSGAGKYSVRMQNTLYGTPFVWSFKIPTGNIQNKTMVVSVWCKIKNASYYTALKTMPKLTIEFDDGVGSGYAEALQNTGWQLLTVPFTPTTEFGEITAKIETNSNAGDKGVVSMPAGTPCVVTLAGHGFTGNERIMFTTDDTLPTGVTATDKYYVKYINPDTFTFSLTRGGTDIDTTDDGIGNHSVFSLEDVYVYFDDVAVFYPPDSSLNLGGLDLWSNAMPITPPIATSLGAMDVWAVQKSTQTTDGSMGKTVVDTDKKTGLIPALL